MEEVQAQNLCQERVCIHKFIKINYTTANYLLRKTIINEQHLLRLSTSRFSREEYLMISALRRIMPCYNMTLETELPGKVLGP